MTINGTVAIIEFMITTIIPLADARAEFGKLTDRLEKLKTVLLTKRGRPKAVLVDVDYWEKVMRQLGLLTRKTYISKDLLPYTREFSDAEINEWLKEDRL
ncbi:unnamed protein product [marine sediment metagenome]|uniref:Antitoxin n=1 Tax=marine sediment metagenome TaxID=412755 RepID=X1MU87_9ZZZZ